MASDKPADSPPICDYDGSDYQTRFWEQGDREYEDRVEAIALSRLLPKSGDLLLEIGAGAGRNTPRYQGFQHVVLLDYSLTQLQQAQARLGRNPRYLFVVGDVYRLPFVAGLFHTATMIRTLHHMADAPAALRQVRDCLRLQGAFILEYASKHNLKAIWRYLLRRQSWSPFTLEAVEFAPLNFDFHPKAIHAWLNRSEFQVERQLTVSHFRLGLLKRTVPLRLLVALDALFQWSGDWWQLTPSVFLRARAVGARASSPPGAFFRCPRCSQPFRLAPDDPFSFVEEADKTGQQEHELTCTACGQGYKLRDGIFDFR